MYFGEHYTATSTNIMRATEDIQQLGHPDFQARQVLVATWHRVSPLSIVQLNTLVSLEIKSWDILSLCKKSLLLIHP